MGADDHEVAAEQRSRTRSGALWSARRSRVAGRRIVAFPQAILPVLEDHVTLFAVIEGGPVWRTNFNKLSGMLLR
jgi:hypothetical protein